MRSAAAADLTPKCLDIGQEHNVRIYHDVCEKCKLDLVSTKNALNDAKSHVGGTDHSTTVIVAVVALIIGGLVGAASKN